MKKPVILILFLLCMVTVKPQDKIINYWSFDEFLNNKIIDHATGDSDSILGNYSVVQGILGLGLKCDGFTTRIVRNAENSPRLTNKFTIEAWIAPQTYPWNWCAIVNQEFNHQRGYFFGIDAEGRIGLHLAINRQWREFISDEKVPFMKWSYVLASFDSKSGVKLYINGNLVNHFKVTGTLLNDIEMDLEIARNHHKTIPASLNRAGRIRTPASYSFDGIIDELKIYENALDEKVIKNKYLSVEINEPDLKWWKLPSLKNKLKEFGAFYTELKYDPDWSTLWQDSDHPDVVITFDDKEYFMNFWKGTNYNLNLVTENNIWIGDQSAEGWSDETGCNEHMSDKQNRYSHVRIIENTEARVVVHWRYALTDIFYDILNTDPITNWGDWTDEYYYIYPDGVAVRHFLIHGKDDDYSITEPTVFSNPGERPEDNINLKAVTLANLNGEYKTYSFETWPTTGEAGADFKDKIEDPVISIVNTKSEYKPFNIYQEGTRIIPYGGGIKEIDYSYSHFHARNHWPVSQIPCDGRFVLAADRVTSSAIISPEPSMIRNDKGELEGRFLTGISDKKITSLIPLAKSWINPPNLQELIGVTGKYDINQRAYLMNKKFTPLSFRLKCSEDNPLANTCFVIENWNSKHLANILLNSVTGNVKQGIIRNTDGNYSLVIWVNEQSAVPVKFDIDYSNE